MKYTYPKTYKNKSTDEQWRILKGNFKELKNIKFTTIWNEIAAEGTFVIPNYRLFGTYNEAVEKVLEALKSSRDWRDGKWGAEYLKQLPVKEQFWAKQDDVIVIGGQFGQQHAGKSVKMVRDTVQDNELPLGIYEVGIMLLTHPERLQDYNDLWIDCSGDEYAPDADGVFSGAPFFFFNDVGVKFGARDLSYANDRYGSPSGFVPEALENRILGSSEFSPLDPSATEIELDGVAEHEAIALLKGRGFKITREY